MGGRTPDSCFIRTPDRNVIRTPCSYDIRIPDSKGRRTGYPNGGRTGYPKGGRIEFYGSPRYSMMILTCLALRLRLFLKGIDNSSRADISFGHPSIHLRNERTASTSLISGKYFFAKSLLFISLKVECWKLKILDVWHVDTLFNINFLKTEIQLLYSKRISRSATFYIYRVS